MTKNAHQLVSREKMVRDSAAKKRELIKQVPPPPHPLHSTPLRLTLLPPYFADSFTSKLTFSQGRCRFLTGAVLRHVTTWT